MKLFLPFLTDDQGKSLKEENAVVVTRSIPDPINNSPEGWENNTVQFTRNNEFRGLVKSYTTSLKFFFEGAKILRDTFYRKGMETVLYFIWLKQNTAFGAGMKYDGWYKGEPDFGTFKDEYDGVSINITEGGFYKDLQANKSITYEIPFDDDAVSLEMDGINLFQKLNYADISELEFSIANYGSNFFGALTLQGQDGSSVNFIIRSQEPEGVGNLTWDEKLSSLNYLLTNTGLEPITINISGKIEFICTIMVSEPAYAIRFRFLRSLQEIGNQNDYQVFSTPSMVVGQVYSGNFSIDITLAPGERLYYEGIFFTGVGTNAAIEFTANSKTVIKFITRQAATVIKANRVYHLGNKLVKKISSKSSLNSILLENDFNLLVSSGDAIRGLPDAVIKTTFSDYHKSVDAVKCIALEIVNNNPVITSRYEKFNKDSTIANLGECSNWTLEPAEEYIYDSVEVGYPAKAANSNDDVNGKFSFNNTFLWKLDVTRRKINLYDAKSIYFADPYDIELIRVQFFSKDTTTSTTDNSNFFIDAEKVYPNYLGEVIITAAPSVITLNAVDFNLQNGARFKILTGLNSKNFTVIYAYEYNSQTIIEVVESVTTETITTTVEFLHYRLRRLAYSSLTGVNDNTIFNIELSPKRILQNHLRWLRSSFDHLDGNKLVFQTTEKNKDLQTIDSAGTRIAEKEDIPVASMGVKVFLPYLTKFDIQSPNNLLELMNNNSGVFKYTLGGIEMDGFVEEVRTQDATLETQEYSLLMSANNNNLRLINR